jgi:hypothetical protein
MSALKLGTGVVVHRYLCTVFLLAKPGSKKDTSFLARFLTFSDDFADGRLA